MTEPGGSGKRVWRDNGLSIVLFALFLGTMGGQIVSGWLEHNHDLVAHHEQTVGFLGYFATGHLWEATGENWESEFLQMAAFVLLTTFLYQRGSAESKRPGVTEEIDLDPRDFQDREDAPGPVRRGGWRLALYQHSLGLTFAALFLFSIAMHAIGGLATYNSDQHDHQEPAVTLAQFLVTSRFWFESFQNWQSEFLSLGMMVVCTIWLRQRGSAESKPVHAPHTETGKA
jgi:hypothetical protein